MFQDLEFTSVTSGKCKPQKTLLIFIVRSCCNISKKGYKKHWTELCRDGAKHLFRYPVSF